MLRSVWLTGLLALATVGFAQPCPKVTYTTQAATLKNLVSSVNCLVGTSDKSNKVAVVDGKTGLQVDAFPIVGPQHTRAYHRIVVALLAVPVGDTTKTALVTAENPAATVAATAGATCRVKLNPDNSVEGECSLTGGTLFVIYRD